jgi:hypothetical protein
MPVFWLLLAAFILAPCACFLLLAVSPKLFDQGSQWFTLSYLHQALAGASAIAIANSLWVSAAAAIFGLCLGFPVAWLATRTTLPGRHLVSPAMWLVLLLPPSWTHRPHQPHRSGPASFPKAPSITPVSFSPATESFSPASEPQTITNRTSTRGYGWKAWPPRSGGPAPIYLCGRGGRCSGR